MSDVHPVAQTRLLVEILEELTGQGAPFHSAPTENALSLLGHGQRGLGYSQFNELLLLLGYDRVNSSFFQYIGDGTTDYRPGSAIVSLDQLRAGVERFRKVALLFFGNVKYAFKNLSRDSEELDFWLQSLTPRDESSFTNRHDPVQPVTTIRGEDTFYLGYIVQRELKRKLEENGSDPEALHAEKTRLEVVQTGIRNHEAYLASDHLDVYIATSMRERHEYLFVSELTRDIFNHPRLATLKLRWFDPTQAYCQDRIDKGLSEALMLKRAKCTVYFVQETDTLGKDSELASTLAQGKPVIAYVPSPGDGFVDDLITRLKDLYPEKTEQQIFAEQLRIFEPDAAWKDPKVRAWLDSPEDLNLEEAKHRLSASIKTHYDRRYQMLREDHPLGIQVNLTTGVANGVLVVRTIDQCAELIRRVLTHRMEFSLRTRKIDGLKYVLLQENVSDCVFRVMTGDSMLTNTFWNFYLEPE